MSDGGTAGQGKLARVIATRGGLAAPEAPRLAALRAPAALLAEAAIRMRQPAAQPAARRGQGMAPT